MEIAKVDFRVGGDGLKFSWIFIYFKEVAHPAILTVIVALSWQTRQITKNPSFIKSFHTVILIQANNLDLSLFCFCLK